MGNCWVSSSNCVLLSTYFFLSSLNLFFNFPAYSFCLVKKLINSSLEAVSRLIVLASLGGRLSELEVEFVPEVRESKIVNDCFENDFNPSIILFPPPPTSLLELLSSPIPGGSLRINSSFSSLDKPIFFKNSDIWENKE